MKFVGRIGVGKSWTRTRLRGLIVRLLRLYVTIKFYYFFLQIVNHLSDTRRIFVRGGHAFRKTGQSEEQEQDQSDYFHLYNFTEKLDLLPGANKH